LTGIVAFMALLEVKMGAGESKKSIPSPPTSSEKLVHGALQAS
jgi:hypothetical protein